MESIACRCRRKNTYIVLSDGGQHSQRLLIGSKEVAGLNQLLPCHQGVLQGLDDATSPSNWNIAMPGNPVGGESLETLDRGRSIVPAFHGDKRRT